MNLRFNIFLIFLVLGLASWCYYLYSDSGQEDLKGLIKRADSPEYVGKESNVIAYDLNGLPKYSASALEIKRFENEERTLFSKPVVNVFNTIKDEKQWVLTADQAEMTGEKLLHLAGNIVLQSQDKTSQLQRIETEQLTVDLNTQDISSQSDVKAQGQGFVTTGVGLTGNLKTEVVTLHHGVNTYLEPTTITKPAKSSNQ